MISHIQGRLSDLGPTSSGIGDKDTLVHGSVDELCYPLSRFVEQIDILISQKLIRSGFGEFLVAA